jgi:hypothetical protein
MPDPPRHRYEDYRQVDKVACCLVIAARDATHRQQQLTILAPKTVAAEQRLWSVAKELGRRARPMDETGGIERMKDFSNASFPPDTIKVMTQTLNGALSTLAHPVSSATVQS